MMRTPLAVITRKRALSTILLLVVSISMFAQISGPEVCATGIDNTYTCYGTNSLSWSVNGIGTIISTSLSGPVSVAVIRWNYQGAGVVSLNVNGTVYTKNVTALGMPVPPEASHRSRCGPGVVTFSTSAGQGGTTVRWFDVATGGSFLAEGNTYSPSVSASKTFYAATYNASTNQYSSRTPCVATVNPIPTAQPVISMNLRIGPGPLTLTATGSSSCRWYNPSGTLLGTGLTFTTPIVSASATNYMYALPYEPGTGCAGTTQTWINITIDPLPATTASTTRIALSKPVVLTVNAGYATYEWRKDDSQVVGTTRAVTIHTPGDYAVKVTKNGYSGVGMSLPITIGTQLGDQDQNFIVTNKLQFATRDVTRIDSVPVDSLTQTVQYFDGLGRLLQTNTTQSSPSRADVVVPVSYDDFGREVKKYLPYVSGEDGRYKSNALSDPSDTNTDPLIHYRTGNQYLFYQGTALIAYDQYPYAEALLESGPLNRPLQQGAPGQAWQPNSASTFTTPASTGKASLYNYNFNVANEVLLWRHLPSETFPLGLVYAGTATAPRYYPANRIYKTCVKDENRNQVITYTDTEGKVILKRVQITAGANPTVNDSNFASTYYIYDSFGQLVCVLPPEAVKNLATQYHHATANEATKNAFLNLWAFRYRYDAQLRMVQKKMPGAKPVYMVYDTRGRVVLTQDGNQRSNPAREWSFIKYDALNRPITTGKYYNVDSLQILQAKLDADTAPKFENYTGTGSYFGYSNQSFPTSPTAGQYLTVSYYDKYDSNIAPTGYAYVNESLPGQETTSFANVVGQMTGTLTRNLGTLTMQRSVNYFDWKKRNIQSITQHHRTGTIRASTVYDFVDKVLTSQKTYVINGVTTKLKETNRYDHAGRMLTKLHSVNGSQEVIIASSRYNEIGQLIDKQLHSVDGATTFKQSIDYRYNIRGWLTKLNEPDIRSIAPGDAAHDYYGMELAYNTGLSGITSTSMYNGNIAAIQWSKGVAAGAEIQAYAFGYDPLNRLLNANHSDNELDITNGIRTWKSNGNQYSEALTYDYNGNIKSLARKGTNGSAMDNLTYGYSGNMLLYVNDAGNAATGFVNANNSTDDYSYDYNGNLDKDKNKGMVVKGSIKYNFLNLPDEIVKGAEKVKYIYDATGLKLSQEVYNSSGVLSKVTDYVGEMILEGTTSATTLKLIRHPEGRVLPDGASWEYQYHLTDHLGNVRVTFTGKAQSTTNYTANFESAVNNNFLNYSRHTFDLVDHTDAGTTYQNTQRLTGAARVGLAKTFAVMPGDKIIASAYVKYMNLSSTANTASFINSLASAFGVSSMSTGESAKIYTSLNGYAGMVSGGHLNDDDSGPPKAFITILFFDKDYKLLDAAWDQVSSAGAQTSATVKQPHDFVTVTANAPDCGYAYVFLSNEHATNVEVFFDDVSMGVLPSAIVGVDDYYPFGMVYNSHQRSDTYNQDFKFQGQEHVDDLGLHWDSFKWRNHDPAIGRFFNVDPLAEKYVYNSPYAFSENHVTVHVELEGLEKVYVFDQAQRPQDNGTPGTSYTAEVYVVNEQNGSVSGPYSGSSYPNSISNTNNSTAHKTVTEGEHLYNNLSGHNKSSEKGLNLVNTNGDRIVPGFKPDGSAVDVSVANVHKGFSDLGNATSRGSKACLTIKPSDTQGFFSNFDWSGSKTVTKSDGSQVTYNGTTGNASGTISIHRGDTQAAKLDKAKIELLKVSISQLNNDGQYIKKDD